MDINNYSYTPHMLEDAQNTDTRPANDPRVIALDLLYNIPGYIDTKIDTKNFIYDIVVKKIASLCEQTKEVIT